MIHLMIEYRVKKDELEAVKKAVADFVDAVKDNETQTIHYISYQIAEDPLSFVHYMMFENEEAKQTHEKAEYTKEFADLLYPACEEEPVFTNLDMIKCNKHL